MYYSHCFFVRVYYMVLFIDYVRYCEKYWILFYPCCRFFVMFMAASKRSVHWQVLSDTMHKMASCASNHFEFNNDDDSNNNINNTSPLQSALSSRCTAFLQTNCLVMWMNSAVVCNTIFFLYLIWIRISTCKPHLMFVISVEERTCVSVYLLYCRLLRIVHRVSRA